MNDCDTDNVTFDWETVYGSMINVCAYFICLIDKKIERVYFFSNFYFFDYSDPKALLSSSMELKQKLASVI